MKALPLLNDNVRVENHVLFEEIEVEWQMKTLPLSPVSAEDSDVQMNIEGSESPNYILGVEWQMKTLPLSPVSAKDSDV